MNVSRHLVRSGVLPVVLVGAVCVLGALIGYGVYRERAEQPSPAAPSPPVDAPQPAIPMAGPTARPPAPTDPTARDLMQVVCKGGENPCVCRRDVIKKAFALALQSAAREALDGAPADCVPELESSGLRAEVLARVGDLKAARQEAEALLLQQPKNPHATFATALVLLARGETQRSRSVAQRAAELGRGAPAHMLLGVLALRDDQLREAERHLNEALVQDEDDVEALFNRAVLFERQRQYNGAREGYLKVLALRPTHADSRYALARLTHAAGAFDEARHHLRKLEEIAPHDERIAGIAAKLQGERPSSAVHRTASEQ